MNISLLWQTITVGRGGGKDTVSLNLFLHLWLDVMEALTGMPGVRMALVFCNPLRAWTRSFHVFTCRLMLISWSYLLNIKYVQTAASLLRLKFSFLPVSFSPQVLKGLTLPALFFEKSLNLAFFQVFCIQIFFSKRKTHLLLYILIVKQSLSSSQIYWF